MPRLHHCKHIVREKVALQMSWRAFVKQEVMHQQQADCGCGLEKVDVALLPLPVPSPLLLCAWAPC